VADVAAIPPGEGPVIDDFGVHDHLDPHLEEGEALALLERLGADLTPRRVPSRRVCPLHQVLPPLEQVNGLARGHAGLARVEGRNLGRDRLLGGGRASRAPCACRSRRVGRPFATQSVASHSSALPCLLLAHWHAGMTVGLKVIVRQRALVVHMPVNGHHPRWPLRPEPYPRVATTEEPTLASFGPPTLD
jgi:hypothetical protein